MNPTLTLAPPKRGDIYSVTERVECNWTWDYEPPRLEITGNPEYLRALRRFLVWSMELNGDLSV